MIILELIGFIFIVVLGTLLHFMYEWSNHNKYVAIFAAVNESTFEHIKMALTPMFLWIIIEIPFIGNVDNFIIGKFVSIITVCLLIPSLFYGYMAILKKHVLFIDITIFILSIFLSQLFSFYILSLKELPFLVNYFSLIGTIVLFIIYMVSTMIPFKNKIYQDPITKKYGIKGHK